MTFWGERMRSLKGAVLFEKMRKRSARAEVEPWAQHEPQYWGTERGERGAASGRRVLCWLRMGVRRLTALPEAVRQSHDAGGDTSGARGSGDRITGFGCGGRVSPSGHTPGG